MKRRVLATAVLAALAVWVTVTLVEGRPRHLPGVALASPVLLHAERALALFAVTVAMLSMGVQAARGRLPIELSSSGLRDEVEAAERAAAAVAELQEQYNRRRQSATAASSRRRTELAEADSDEATRWS